MLAEVVWSSLTAAGAFILGAAFATVGTIRIMRAVVALLVDAEASRTPPERRTPLGRPDTADPPRATRGGP